MTNDPELKAMSQVFDALQNLDGATQNRVVEWVLSKLQSQSSVAPSKGAKRGPKPGTKYRKRGRPTLSSSPASTGSKRGPKPGSKRKRKPGRPKGSKNIAPSAKTGTPPKRRGRPRKEVL